MCIKFSREVHHVRSASKMPHLRLIAGNSSSTVAWTTRDERSITSISRAHLAPEEGREDHGVQCGEVCT